MRCAIYTRISSAERLDRDFNSLDAQRAACATFILQRNWVAVEATYDDGGFSGGNTQRPALQRLLADIDTGTIDMVVVHKIDRLSRSLKDFLNVVDVLERAGVGFASVTQAFDTSTSSGRLMLHMLLSFAQFEREMTAERMRDRYLAGRRTGRWMAGRRSRPFGYQVVNGRLALDPAEAAIVRRIYERYLSLGSTRLLAEELAAEGVINPNSGRSFSRFGLAVVLSNRTYRGDIVYRGAVIDGPKHEPIVSETLWQQVRAMRAESRSWWRHHHRFPIHDPFR